MNKIKFLPFYLISVLPFSGLYLLSDILFISAYYLIKYRRGVVRENLLASFPDKSQNEILSIEKRYYRHLCDIVVESLKLLTISKRSIERRFKLKDKELIDQLYRDNKSIILYTAHYGHWEWLAFLPLFLTHKVTAFYRPLSNKYFDQLTKLIRTRFGVLCIESKTGYKTLLKFKEDNLISLNCIIADQSPPTGENCYWTMFLHRETAFYSGAEKIAKRLNDTVVYPYFKKLNRGYYEVSFKIIEEFPEQSECHNLIDKYAQILEEQIIEAPELWLWSHKRWKLSKPDKTSMS